MSSNEGHTAGSDSQEKYESAVLDFLNKEMAAVQPVQEQDEPSEDLDALVSDLLRQVIAESDQSPNGQKVIPDEMDNLLSEFPSKLEETLPSNGKTFGLPVITPAALIDVEPDGSIKIAGEASKSQSPTIPADFVFRPLLIPKRRTPMIALAAAGLMAIIGVAVYHFSGSTKSVSNNAGPQPYAAAPLALEKKDLPAAVQPAGKAMLDKTPVVQRASNTSPAAPVQKPSASGVQAQPAAVQQAMKPAKGTPAPAKPEVAGKPAGAAPDNEQKAAMERSPAAQSAPSTQAAVAPSPAIEKPAPPAVSNIAAPENAVAEKKPAQPVPVAPLSVENSIPASQPPAPTPVVPKALVPAVPISQTSAAYPEIALRTRSSGSVVLDLQIDEQGKVVKATPVSGPILFHTAAVSAAMKWRYRPASVGGKNVPSESRVTMKFNLK